MEKPVVFLSHSSADRLLLGRLKEALVRLTNGAVDFFLSSDGQSIRLGTNWVSSVEEALSACELMFVFVSPAAARSQWIYFESGYAYSRKIEVVPVGILGQDVSILKPPLSLLQGFNLRDASSFGNIPTLINTKYKCSFPTSIVEEDYRSLFLSAEGRLWGSRAEFLKSFGFHGLDTAKSGMTVTIEEYLARNRVEYAIAEGASYGKPWTRIDLNSISIQFRHYDESDSFDIDVDPYYWQKAFPQVRAILEQFSSRLVDKPQFSIHLQGCSIAVREKHRILPRLKAQGVSLQKDGTFTYKGVTTFWLDREERYEANGESYEADPIVNFITTLEDIDIDSILPVIELLFDSHIVEEGYAHVFEY
jgi:hypothetical protein